MPAKKKTKTKKGKKSKNIAAGSDAQPPQQILNDEMRQQQEVGLIGEQENPIAITQIAQPSDLIVNVKPADKDDLNGLIQLGNEAEGQPINQIVADHAKEIVPDNAKNVENSMEIINKRKKKVKSLKKPKVPENILSGSSNQLPLNDDTIQ